MDLTRQASTSRDIREASTAAPRDEGGTRDLWERFGQVAPPPPRTLGAIRAAVDAVVASPPFKLVLCVLYAFGPEDIKESSPGNIALREQLAKDGSSAETIETTMIVHRGICMGWGVAEIFLSLLGVTLLMKVCRYFTPEPASWMVW